MTCAVVAEWLRRLTRNQIPSGSVGSNPTDCDNIFLLASHLSIGQERLHMKTVQPPRADIMDCNVGSVVECSPATRAARVRFPDVANFSSFPNYSFSPPSLPG